MADTKFAKTRIANKVEKLEEEKKSQQKKKLLILITEFLERHGYMGTASYLQTEIGFNLRQFCVCDNIDLEIILQEFEIFYNIKYGKPVQIYKKNENIQTVETENKRKHLRQKLPFTMSTQNEPFKFKAVAVTESNERDMFQPLGPYANLNVDNEYRILAGIVVQEMLSERPNVYWNDVIGHEDAKNTLKDSLVYPMKYPQLYTIVKPWKGLLLFGPTGTGKTMLAKAAATECQSTFFNVSTATFTSKWRGESEKLVKVLFELARFHEPSIIFFDEVDSVMSRRTSTEHEASRRFKSELLSQMDGLTTGQGNVFVLTASNSPWDLDLAFLRRMECRQYIAPPNIQALKDLYEKYLPSSIKYDSYTIQICANYKTLANASEGYTGADVFLVCKRVKLEAVRKIVDILENCNSKNQTVPFAPITMTDLMSSLHKVKPIHLDILNQYEKFFNNDNN